MFAIVIYARYRCLIVDLAENSVSLHTYWRVFVEISIVLNKDNINFFDQHRTSHMTTSEA